MDGNNRWSIKNKKSKFYTYSLGAKNIIKLSSYIFKNLETNFISAFALSANNLNRSKKTINIIKKVLIDFLDNEIMIKKLDFKIKFIGDKSFLNKNVLKKIDLLENRNINSKKVLAIFINYSGKKDIIQVFENANNKNLNLINEKIFSKNLLTYGIPDPDILIRTGGFQRISDFMLFQLSFTELFFLKKLWIDFNYSDIRKIILKFRRIDRKFGV